MHPTGQPAPAPATWANYKRATHFAGNEDEAAEGEGNRDGDGCGVRGRAWPQFFVNIFEQHLLALVDNLSTPRVLPRDCKDSGTGAAWHRWATLSEMNEQQLQLNVNRKQMLPFQCFISFLFYTNLLFEYSTIFFKEF